MPARIKTGKRNIDFQKSVPTPSRGIIKDNNFGKRSESGSGGYAVKVFDAYNNKNSYSIKDGFNFETEKFPYLINNKRKDVFHLHQNRDVSENNPTQAFRRRHLGNGRLRSSATILNPHNEEQYFDQIDIRRQKSNRNRRRLRG